MFSTQTRARSIAQQTMLLLASIAIGGSLLASSAFAQAPQRVQIAVAGAKLQKGDAVVRVAQVGEQFDVLAVNGKWLKVALPPGSTSPDAWILESSTRTVAASSAAAGPAPPPAGAKVAIPAVTQKLRVVADDVPLMKGTRTVATLQRGEIHPLEKVQGNFYSIAVEVDGVDDSGWVAKSSLELVPTGAVGRSLAGNDPSSAAEAKVSVDWSIERISVTLPPIAVDLSGTTKLVNPQIATLGAAAAASPKIDPTKPLSITSKGLESCLTPGTRSLWIAIEKKYETIYHRVDMPAPELMTSLAASPDPDDATALLVEVPVKSVVPGFAMEYAWIDAAAVAAKQPPRKWFPMARSGEALPQLVSIRSESAAELVRLKIPKTSSPAAPQLLAIRLRNPDGSTSASIVITRSGDTVKQTAELLTAPTFALVDSSIEMPSVTWLTGAEASALLDAVGVRTKYVADDSLAPVELSRAETRSVIRQAIESGEPVLYRDTVVLTVDVPADRLLAAARLDETLPPAPLDASDDLALVPVSSSMSGEVTRPNNMTIDDAQLTSTLTQSKLDEQMLENSTAMLFDADAGMSLRPGRVKSQLERAIAARLLLEAILKQPSYQDLPGPVGKAITTAIVKHEESLRGAMGIQPEGVQGAGKPGVPPDPSRMVNLSTNVLGAMGLTIQQTDRDRLNEHLSRFCTLRWHPFLLDRNQNGKVADDVAVAAVVWLVEEGLYDPLANLVMLPPLTPGSGPVGMVSSEPHEPEIANQLLSLLGLLGSIQLPKPPPVVVPMGTTPPTVPAKPPVPPTGKPLVSMKLPPDEVRVPEVVDGSIQTASTRLKNLGLGLSDANKFFQGDRITGVTPKARTWVPSGSMVEINAQRQVPNLIRLAKEDAVKELDRHRFRLIVAEKTTDRDIVIEQSPVAGEYVAVGSPVEIELAAIVPGVVGSLQRDAVKTLLEKGLSWRARTKAFQLDKVVAQDPQPGALFPSNGEVLLELHLPVPNVIGKTRSQAEEILTNFDLQIEVLTRLARDGDIVRGQRPAAGSYAPHQSTAAIGPIVTTVPDVRGRSVGNAESLLTDGDFASQRKGDLIFEDKVTFQTPNPGVEIERGATIVLDARVRMPDVRGQLLARAQGIIRGADGGLESEITDGAGARDVVYSQSINPGEFVYPRTVVRLVPGVNIPNVRGLSRREAFDQFTAIEMFAEVVSSGTAETTDRGLVGRTVVAGQNPAPGIYRRSDVSGVRLSETFYILAERTVPDVSGMGIAEAFNTIRNAGLTPYVSFEGREYDQGGFALFALGYALANDGANIASGSAGRSSPGAGARVPAGSRVVFGILLER